MKKIIVNRSDHLQDTTMSLKKFKKQVGDNFYQKRRDNNPLNLKKYDLFVMMRNDGCHSVFIVDNLKSFGSDKLIKYSMLTVVEEEEHRGGTSSTRRRASGVVHELIAEGLSVPEIEEFINL